MGFNFRKSFKLGLVRVNLSKSGVGYSVGTKGFRFTKSAKNKKGKESALAQGFKGLLGLSALTLLIVLIVLYKWVFIILGVLALAGLVAYLIYVHKQLHPTSHSLDTTSPSGADVENASNET